jgi:hypothetical protein
MCGSCGQLCGSCGHVMRATGFDALLKSRHEEFIASKINGEWS